MPCYAVPRRGSRNERDFGWLIARGWFTRDATTLDHVRSTDADVRHAPVRKPPDVQLRTRAPLAGIAQDVAGWPDQQWWKSFGDALQANTIALNDILWLFGIVFAAIVFFVWLAKPPFGAAGDAPAGSPPFTHRRTNRDYSAVVGSMIDLTSDTLFAGKPPCLACSRTIASFGAL